MAPDGTQSANYADPYAQTLGEVARRLSEVFQRYESLASSLPNNFVAKEVYQADQRTLTAERQITTNEFMNLTRRVEELEDDKRWLWRLVIGAMLLAVIGTAFAASTIINSPNTTSNTNVKRSVATTNEWLPHHA